MNNIKRLTASIFFLFLQTFCFGQFEVKPTREPVGDHFLERIDCRVPPPVTFFDYSINKNRTINFSAELNEYRQKRDYITWGHEATHFINSNIRYNKIGYNGLYLVSLNQGFLLKEPEHIHILSVWTSIPKENRCDVYDLYFEQSKSWRDKPLYVYDEFSAYVNGACVASQYKDEPTVKSVTNHTINAYKLGYFSLYILNKIKGNMEPLVILSEDRIDIKEDYKDYDKLKDVTKKLFAEIKKYGDKEQAKSICNHLTKDEVMLKFCQDEFGCNFFGE